MLPKTVAHYFSPPDAPSDLKTTLQKMQIFYSDLFCRNVIILEDCVKYETL